MLALVPCIGPFISLLLGISFLNPGLGAPVASAMIKFVPAALTPIGAVFLAAIF